MQNLLRFLSNQINGNTGTRLDRSLKKNVKQLQKEIKQHRGKERSKDEAKCLEKLGFLHFDHKFFDEAIEHWTEALRVYQEINDRRSMAESYSNIGTSYRMSGDLKSAARFYYKALLLDHEFNAGDGELTSLHNLGGTWFDLGEFDDALESYRDALEISRNLKLQEWQILTLYRIALTLQGQHLHHRSFEFFSEALELAQASNQLEWLTKCTYGLGLNYDYLSDYSQAIPCYEDALAGAVKIGDHALESIILTAYSRMNIHIGLLDKAREQSRLAEEKTIVIQNRNIDLYLLRAEIYALQGMMQKTFDLIEEAEDLAGRMTNFYQFAEVLIAKAGYELESSRYKNAYDIMIKIPAKFPDGESHLIDLKSALVWGRIYRALKQDDDALNARETAVAKAEILGIPRYLWITHHALGRYYQYQQRLDLAREQYQASLKWIDSASSSLEPSLRKTFLNHRERLQVYQDYVVLQISTGHREIAERTLRRLDSPSLYRKVKHFFE